MTLLELQVKYISATIFDWRPIFAKNLPSYYILQTSSVSQVAAPGPQGQKFKKSQKKNFNQFKFYIW
jgi:hypothetical protein